ncbi:septation inhibitor protein [Methylobacterium sp. Leaf399]|uniref:septum site-determining protein MinC n=1 Tax=unclassified Methylobacterium TaxID=2615210 RepID=UPI0006FA6476|nr:MULTISPECIES: septum site-determining protein MinC [unclassified Methylobacterium]KQP52674.1 septation inhibitor protein [Methylobacterium sp. Leaf108]KQT11853.1 septation inhibitor protein [Methylobacterium sp. Leaf399]KQT84385.1 septation inhibitor protein [Methylobacterium sp. Leaf466]
MTQTSPTRRAVQIRGRAFKALILTPATPIDDWFVDIDASLRRSPTLFDGRPVILDVATLAPDRLGLQAVLAGLTARKIRILGIEGAAPALSDLAFPPLLSAGRPVATIEIPVEPSEADLTSLVVEGSVRSGQSIVHRGGDVTVMGSVSSGAEILAGGSIHVYGALRGRAIAGAARNPRARIYCRKFEPELLGIDRLVRTAEDMGPAFRGRSAQVWLDGSAIKIAALE